jgi:anti-sigma factor RsiW
MKPDTLTSELSAYVNGTLDEAHRKKVEQLISDDPKVQQKYAFFQALRKTMIDSLPPVPENYGLDTLKQRIAEDARRERLSASRQPGVWERISQWLFKPSLSFAVAAVFFVLQLGVVVSVMQETAPDYAEYRAPPQAAMVAGPFIRLSFKPAAREEDIRFLLVATGVSIIGGPTQLGDYYLYIAADRTDWAVKQLRQSPIVDQASVIARLPQAKE